MRGIAADLFPDCHCWEPFHLLVVAAAAAAAAAAVTLSGAVRHAAVEPDAVAAIFVVELGLGLGLGHGHDAVQRLGCWPL